MSAIQRTQHFPCRSSRRWRMATTSTRRRKRCSKVPRRVVASLSGLATTRGWAGSFRPASKPRNTWSRRTTVRWTPVKGSIDLYCRRNGRAFRIVRGNDKRWKLYRIKCLEDAGELLGTYLGRGEANKALQTIAYQPEPRW